MQTNPVKAIREKCLDCCCGSAQEVSMCVIEDCALYAFRLGKNPYRKKREVPEEHIRNMVEARRKKAEVDNLPGEELESAD